MTSDRPYAVTSSIIELFGKQDLFYQVRGIATIRQAADPDLVSSLSLDL